MWGQKNSNKILIIGGTGFIGCNLAEYLVNLGNEITVFHREESNLRSLSGLPFGTKVGDLADKDNRERDLYKAMEGCQIVYNLATCSSLLKKHFYLREAINRDAARTIAYVARKVGIERLIHVSSSVAVGFPDKGKIADEGFTFNAHYDHYALTKYQGEMAVLEEVGKGLNAVVGIPCSTVGLKGMKPAQLDTFKKIIRGRMFLCPPGGLCLTNVDDLVRGLYLCYAKGQSGKRYILGGHNIKYKRYFGEIATAAGVNAPKILLPKVSLSLLGFAMEIVSNFLKKDTIINKHVVTLVSKDLYYSSELAIRELGYIISDWKKNIRQIVSQLLL